KRCSTNCSKQSTRTCANKNHGFESARNLRRKKITAQKKMEHTKSTTKIAKDPICGMNVDPTKAAAIIEFNGQPYYFCSKGCAAKFQQNPTKFLAAAANAPTASQHEHLAAPQQIAPAPLQQISAPTSSDHSCCSHGSSPAPQNARTATS